MTERRYGDRTFATSHEEKVLFPDDGITKGDLMDYYERVADTMLPHLRDRPLAMRRFPDGIDGEGFFQKQVPDHFPAWIRRVRVEKEGGEQDLVVCDDTATLVYLAQQACITPHVWPSLAGAPDRPDRMVFDLDPPGDDFAPVREAALALRDLLDEVALPAYAQTTGSRGVHVVVPLDRSASFGDAREVVRAVADAFAARAPDARTTEVRKEKRRGRLYVDVSSNAYAHTTVAPYGVRARPGAPVATPVTWDELARKDLHARTYTVRNILRRLGQRDDPWKGMGRRAVSIARARERVADL